MPIKEASNGDFIVATHVNCRPSKTCFCEKTRTLTELPAISAEVLAWLVLLPAYSGPTISDHDSSAVAAAKVSRLRAELFDIIIGRQLWRRLNHVQIAQIRAETTRARRTPAPACRLVLARFLCTVIGRHNQVGGQLSLALDINWPTTVHIELTMFAEHFSNLLAHLYPAQNSATLKTWGHVNGVAPDIVGGFWSALKQSARLEELVSINKDSKQAPACYCAFDNLPTTPAITGPMAMPIRSLNSWKASALNSYSPDRIDDQVDMPARAHASTTR